MNPDALTVVEQLPAEPGRHSTLYGIRTECHPTDCACYDCTFARMARLTWVLDCKYLGANGTVKREREFLESR